MGAGCPLSLIPWVSSRDQITVVECIREICSGNSSKLSSPHTFIRRKRQPQGDGWVEYLAFGNHLALSIHGYIGRNVHIPMLHTLNIQNHRLSLIFQWSWKSICSTEETVIYLSRLQRRIRASRGLHWESMAHLYTQELAITAIMHNTTCVISIVFFGTLKLVGQCPPDSSFSFHRFILDLNPGNVSQSWVSIRRNAGVHTAEIPEHPWSSLQWSR